VLIATGSSQYCKAILWIQQFFARLFFILGCKLWNKDGFSLTGIDIFGIHNISKNIARGESTVV
jgi:hypothetical protein